MNNPNFFHLLEPFRSGGWRQANAATQLREAKPCVSLQFFKKLSSVKVHQGR
jgi:hypothetical protein